MVVSGYSGGDGQFLCWQRSAVLVCYLPVLDQVVINKLDLVVHGIAARNTLSGEWPLAVISSHCASWMEACHHHVIIMSSSCIMHEREAHPLMRGRLLLTVAGAPDKSSPSLHVLM